MRHDDFMRKKNCPTASAPLAAAHAKLNVRELQIGRQKKMERLGRDVPLPDEMQGRWFDVDDAISELIIQGGEIICFGKPVAYDYKVIAAEDDALMVSLKIYDEADEDAFQRSNITELVMTPEGDFHAYNVKFSSQFERA